jgi:hypothetical protein
LGIYSTDGRKRKIANEIFIGVCKDEIEMRVYAKKGKNYCN